jgi:radical SAM superfamily enzyme YgiQ (UPF0313 family)
MNLFLIKPGFGNLIEGYNLNDGAMEPLSLAILAGATPPDFSVTLYDDRIETIPFDDDVDIAGISVDTFTARRAYEIADRFRKRNVKVVLGGIHVRLFPEEAMKHADCIITGDAEQLWPEVLRSISAGLFRRRYDADAAMPQQGVFPDRTIFRGKKYLPVSLVQFGRGCRFSCTYCAVSSYFRKKHTCRPVEDVLDEIRRDNLKTVLFVDDNFVADPEKTKAFLDALIPLKIRWASQSGIEMTEDPEMLELMVKSGCVGHLIGFESINPAALRGFNKRNNLHHFDRYQTTIKRLRSFGLLTWASMIVGNDEDTRESIEQTVRFAIESKFAVCFFHILMPYPGTGIYENLKRQKRLLYDNAWWQSPDYRYNKAAFVPKNLTPEQLSNAAIKANHDFYRWGSIASRLLDPATNFRSAMNLFLYLRFNTLLRKTSI